MFVNNVACNDMISIEDFKDADIKRISSYHLELDMACICKLSEVKILITLVSRSKWCFVIQLYLKSYGSLICLRLGKLTLKL